MNGIILGQLVLLGIFSWLLVKATDLTIRSLSGLSRSLKVGNFAITAFLLALATSVPELFVSVAAALEGKPNLVLGVVLGANIADLSLVIGGAALIGGSIPVLGNFLRRDLFYTFLAGALPLILLLDKRLGAVDGLILLAVYLIYNYTVFRDQPRIEALTQESLWRRILKRLNNRPTEKQLIWFFAGISLLILAADFIVRIASLLAQNLGLPTLLVGLILVAIGTTLPELTFEIKAARQHKVAMVFGNLLGSVVANSTLILGLTAVLKPIKLDGGFASYLLASIAFLIIFNLFWLFVRTKKKLSRWEGAALILLYAGFVLFELWQAQNHF